VFGRVHLSGRVHGVFMYLVHFVYPPSAKADTPRHTLLDTDVRYRRQASRVRYRRQASRVRYRRQASRVRYRRQASRVRYRRQY
jgi:hypothetical protein